ncbi:alkane 1-monooxygenase [Pseudobacteriovorax antillogorgiicola]|uniref:Alkane 1-monooxygenase n=1 Tax=Pseudobacteriovorax antillogorgiicola TaxID=1513793 RepID=A0A1Y6CGB8_9BACT|nr:alkane 1-monooxygenase [Pseudobacteriovorax antillogorgiicola]TCS49100.1 alkane 1-monooxygenase [Pseudobacteriovorax antillogorgiicola]SMF51735.1 alkane 1-monooxygenase [Pseudobacteriovorax antillogorgiicola]
MKASSYYVCYVIPGAFVLGLMLGGVWLGLPFFLAFFLVPIFDVVMGKDPENLSPVEEEQIKNDFSFQLVTLLWVPTQIAVVVLGAWYGATYSLAWWEFGLLILSAGVNGGGLGITIAHELCHRQSKLEQRSSLIILAFINYMHFFIEHVVGHHSRVSTPEDPATAPRGMGFYEFFPRTVVGSYKSAWEFEARRVATRKLSAWKLQNRMINYLMIQGLICLGLLWAFGPWGLLFHLGQSFISFSLLEVINYIEHYGLQRRQDERGRFEKVLPIHSWNANHKVSNLFLFKLQRHSDHHANALRRYQVLRHFEEAPQLPASYPVMVLLALCPPLFKRMMNLRLEQHDRSVAATHAF